MGIEERLNKLEEAVESLKEKTTPEFTQIANGCPKCGSWWMVVAPYPRCNMAAMDFSAKCSNPACGYMP